jgi:hypothetical protein
MSGRGLRRHGREFRERIKVRGEVRNTWEMRDVSEVWAIR